MHCLIIMKLFNTLSQTVGLLSLSLAVDAISVDRNFACNPHHPFRPLPLSQLRTRTCHVANNGNGVDDSKNIMKALHACNHGGKVVFDAGKTYTIGTALDMTFLKHIDLGE